MACVLSHCVIYYIYRKKNIKTLFKVKKWKNNNKKEYRTFVWGIYYNVRTNS